MLNKVEKPAVKIELVVIKKYANRRLYNTETSTYVTLEDLATMVRSERDFVVYDAKSGDDLTHSVLTQIIVEQESRAGSETLLPVPFLRQLIRFYGDTMQGMVPSYLQVSLDALTREQERFRKQVTTAFTPQGALEAYQEHARKNFALYEKAMAMFTPFAGAKGGVGGGTDDAGKAGNAKADAKPSEAAASSPPGGKELAELKAQLAAMQQKIEKLADDKK